MKRLLVNLFICSLLGPVALAADQPPSDASLKTLLDAMHTSQMLDTFRSQLDGMMAASAQQATAGQAMNEAQQAIAADMSRQMSEIVRDTMSWDKFEPVLVDVYRKSLSQSEVDGMIKFYQSAAGRAYLQKMPAIMQNSVQAMQGLSQEMATKIQKVARESVEKIKAAAGKEASNP
jgi:hypothetical protein